MNKRTTLIAILLAVTMALSGCSVLTGDGATYASDDVSVDDSAVSETNFELERSEWQNRSRDVEVGGEERTINVSSRVEAYSWGGNRGAFAVLATPQIDVAGQGLNPIDEMSNEQLVRRLQSGFDGQGEIEDLEQTGEYTVSAAGEERTVTEFSATATQGEQKTNVSIHVTKFTDDEDIVIGAAVHPESADEVRTDVETMMAGIDH